ncbi:Gfo/Idh/MocA family oxidoreductase [Treponema sp. OttesenSCG-928-L16]|nr:Gfo/Idh/MocA family oxidoreductase [Treponema sp. OttesenSCG-928-L16]
MKSYRVAFIGSGFAAHIHAQAYKKIPGVEVIFHGLFALDKSQAETFAGRYGFERVYDSLDELFSDPAVDVIDVIVPPKDHLELVKRGMEQGKHVICEKPLNGYFGSGHDDKKKMYETVLAELEDFREFLEKQKSKFFYAENFVYAPSVLKIREFIESTGEKILLLKGEESHSGSHGAHAAHWSVNGGGSLIRQGCHPLSALLYLKHCEARKRNEDIRISSLICDSAAISKVIPPGGKSAIVAKPADVEDWAELILSFSDGTKAVVSSGDMIVGGVRNSVEAYTPCSCYSANIAPNDALMVYHAKGEMISGIYITEKNETGEGWQHVFIAEEEMRGYTGELENFLACIEEDREPESGFPLAYDTMRVLYAAYLSAESGERVYF